MAIEKDISFYRGEDVTYAPPMDPVVDITGWAITFSVRAGAADAGAALIEKTVAGGGIAITDGPNGVYTVTIDDTDTTGLLAGLYAYDIKRTDSGAEGLLAVGALILKQEVTR